MTMSLESDSAPPGWCPRSFQEGALLGAAVVLGWILHDVGVFTGGQDPAAFLALLPDSLLLAGSFALLTGVLATRPRAFVVWTLFLLAASLAPLVAHPPVARAVLWLPRAFFLLTLAVLGGTFLARRLGRGLLRFGLALGFAACALTALYRYDLRFVPRVAALVLLGSLVLGFVSRPAPRRIGTALLCLLPLFFPSEGLLPRRELRPDLPPPATGAARPDAPNLLLIVLDTVRADRMSAYGYERATTPGLERFAREHATRYTNVHSTTSWTLPSHASLFTGLYSAEHGADHPRGGTAESTVKLAMRPANRLPDDVLTLAERLRADGYRTAAVVANCAYLNTRYGLDQGFEHYDDHYATWVQKYLALAQFTGRHLEVGHTVTRDAETITDAALTWLESRAEEEPFFLTVNYMDAHEPYLPGGPGHGAFEDTQPIDALTPPRTMWPLLYDRALVRLDAGVTRFLDRVEERGLFANTVVVVTSDHGQSLGEHAYYGHAWTLYEEVTRIPLLVKTVPEEGAGSVDARPLDNVATHDLMLTLLGREAEERDPLRPGPEGWMGEWYAGKTNAMVEDWSTRVGRDLSVDLLAWLEGDRKVIVDSAGGVVAYDLARDPREEVPLELTEEERAAARLRAEVWWKLHPPRSADGADVEIDEDLARQMEALGY